MKEGLFLVVTLIVLASICDTVNQLFLKSAINAIAFSPTFNIVKLARFIIRLIRDPRVRVSFLFSTISLCLWLVVLSKADLNLAFSLDSMHYIFIAFASGMFLKEKVGVVRWVGTAFIVAGIILVSLS